MVIFYTRLYYPDCKKMHNRLTIAELKLMRESEDHVEFKKGEGGNVSYNGSGKEKPKDRRRCIQGYVVALCNEGGVRK